MVESVPRQADRAAQRGQVTAQEAAQQTAQARSRLAQLAEQVAAVEAEVAALKGAIDNYAIAYNAAWRTVQQFESDLGHSERRLADAAKQHVDAQTERDSLAARLAQARMQLAEVRPALPVVQLPIGTTVSST
jgi:chromosome segregation ATPase